MLNPENFLHKRIGVAGKVTRVGVGAVWLEIEDESGKLIVSSERLAEKINCEPGSMAEVVGSLNRATSGGPIYFSAEKFVSCR